MQYEKAPFPMELTDEGIEIEDNPLQPKKALSAIEVTDDGKINEVKLVLPTDLKKA